ncbi:MAG: hypothetical protein ACQEQE_02905 [Bacillota bacterium]
MKKKLVLIIILIIFLLTGCYNESVEIKELLKKPRVSDELNKIKVFLDNNYEDYSLIIPNNGGLNDSIYFKNVLGNKDKEGIVFLKNNKSLNVEILILEKNKNENWILSEKIIKNNYTIDKIYFANLDGDYFNELIIGWQGASHSNKVLNIYTFDQNNNLLSKLEKNYKEFIIDDLIDKKGLELFIIEINKNLGLATGYLYSLDINSKDINLIDSVQMDGYINDYYSIKVGKVSEDTKGILLDVSLGAHSSYTDLIVYKDNKLENIFFNKVWRYTDVTFRKKLIESKDINNDGILEIPLIRIPKIKESEDDFYITKWTKWDENNSLKYLFESYRDDYNNYEIILPPYWQSNFTLDKENRKTTFQYYTSLEDKVINIFEILTVKKEDFLKNEMHYEDYRVIKKGINFVYLVKFLSKDKKMIDYKWIQDNFRIIK